MVLMLYNIGKKSNVPANETTRSVVFSRYVQHGKKAVLFIRHPIAAEILHLCSNTFRKMYIYTVYACLNRNDFDIECKLYSMILKFVMTICWLYYSSKKEMTLNLK